MHSPSHAASKVAVALVAAVAVNLSGQAPAPSGANISFNRDVRPIMSGTCFRCHGPDESSRRAGMRLDLRDEALKRRGNGTPIVPGQPDESLIVRRIFSDDPARVMPPAAIHKELTDAQKQVIRRWIEQGAVYEGQWSYQPVVRPAVPAAAARNPIDAFVQVRLDAEGVKKSPEADRRTLLRRVTLDLTGLAPTALETDAFLADRSPDAYEKVVSRLMASPRYAEKQAIEWLDAVRYADTAGFHGDNPYPVWPYRDWVLKAIRDNKPFDAFTREQLAGDLLPGATVDQRIASAYNRLNRVSGEGGLQEKEYLAKYGADRVRTVSTVWMGSTLGCAECHDHKFDPFKAKDFYAMKAFFADINEPGMARDGNGRNGPEAWGVKLAMPTPDEKRRLEDLDSRIAEARKALADRTAALAEQREQWARATLDRFERGELKWRFQRPVSMSAQAATMTRSRRSRRARRQPAAVQGKAGHEPHRRERRQPRHRDVHDHAQTRRGHVAVARHRSGARRHAAGRIRGARRYRRRAERDRSRRGRAPAVLCDCGIRGRVRQRRDVAGERHRRGSQDGVELRRFRHLFVESVCRVSARTTADHVGQYHHRDPDPPGLAGAAGHARTIPPRVVCRSCLGRRCDRGRHGGGQRGRRGAGIPRASRAPRAGAVGGPRRDRRPGRAFRGDRRRRAWPGCGA